MMLNHRHDIQTWLEQMNITNYVINHDLSVDVMGDVFLGTRGITKLPVQFGCVKGGFYIHRNGLTSLKGCPREVGGDFVASGNVLINLVGGPLVVGEAYRVSGNQLTSLLGAPKKVNTFEAADNLLTDLTFLPVVAQTLDVNKNQISSLAGCPEVLKDMNCSNNQLSTLVGGPKIVAERFFCYENQLTDLIGAPEMTSDLARFDCSRNNIVSVVGAPKRVFEFLAYLNRITSFHGMPQCGTLSLEYNELSSFEGCPAIKHDLNVSHNDISSTRYAPALPGTLNLENNPLREVIELHENMYQIILPYDEHIDFSALIQSKPERIIFSTQDIDAQGRVYFERQAVDMDYLKELVKALNMKNRLEKTLHSNCAHHKPSLQRKI